MHVKFQPRNASGTVHNFLPEHNRFLAAYVASGARYFVEIAGRFLAASRHGATVRPYPCREGRASPIAVAAIRSRAVMKASAAWRNFAFHARKIETAAPALD